MINNPEALLHLLESVASGDVAVDHALEKLKHLNYEPVGDFARIDHHRAWRTGFPEVIWGPGKTAAQIADIIQRMEPHHDCVLATRILPDVFEQLKSMQPNLHYFSQARICSTCALPAEPTHRGNIGLLAAGTADLPVAEEAGITAQLAGFAVHRFFDVGVAGIHRLLSIQKELAEMAVLIVVAGMEGALPSVVAGLVEAPVIAVPTSIGYGANLGGVSALLTMLNSCAPGIGVVNIDNGFGAAVLAAKMVRSQQKISPRSPD